MAYIGNHSSNTIVIDAILTKKGREKLALNGGTLQITKFAVGDDGVDYSLWDPNNANGSNYYGAKIENMPVVEANIDEDKCMRYKLISLDKDSLYVYYIDPSLGSTLTMESNATYTLAPQTRASNVDTTAGYTLILHNTEMAKVQPHGNAASNPIDYNGDATAMSCKGNSFTISSKTLTSNTVSKITIIGNESGATFDITFTVRSAEVAELQHTV